MARSNPYRSGFRQKKKSASTAPKGRVKAHKDAATPGEKSVHATPKTPHLSPGRMERTRRLLLAALRVWELKRRVRE